MNRHLSIVIFLLINISCQPALNPVASEFYTVTEVIDGDTFRVNDGSQKGMKIRLIGLDAPEVRKSAHKDIGYYGKESGNYLHELISGKKVRLEFDVEKYDQYHRILAYVYLEDGTFVNAKLLREGYARVMTFPPNVRYADEFVRLQQKARKQKKGLWK